MRIMYYSDAKSFVRKMRQSVENKIWDRNRHQRRIWKAGYFAGSCVWTLFKNVPDALHAVCLRYVFFVYLQSRLCLVLHAYLTGKFPYLSSRSPPGRSRAFSLWRITPPTPSGFEGLLLSGWTWTERAPRQQPVSQKRPPFPPPPLPPSWSRNARPAFWRRNVEKHDL